MKRLQEIIDWYGLRVSKEKLIEKAYFLLRMDGYDVCILNERYITINGKSYQLIRSKKENRWIAKEF